MGELFTAAFSSSNLFLTILLGLVTLYWLSVIVGAIGMDALDFDIDVDADIDIDVDIDVDVDVDMDIDADGDLGAHGNGDVAHTGGGVMIGVMRFFNLGRVPFMVLISIFILSLWSIAIYCNHDASLINPGNSSGMAALLFFPNFIASLFISKVLTAPLVPVFAKLNTSEKALVMSGKVGTLILGIKDTETGQMKINIDGSLISLTVKSNGGKEIKKGNKVVIIEKIDGSASYIVQKIEHH